MAKLDLARKKMHLNFLRRRLKPTSVSSFTQVLLNETTTAMRMFSNERIPILPLSLSPPLWIGPLYGMLMADEPFVLQSPPALPPSLELKYRGTKTRPSSTISGTNIETGRRRTTSLARVASQHSAKNRIPVVLGGPPSPPRLRVK